MNVKQKFDYLPKCRVELDISYPDVYEKIMSKILENIGNYAGLNKRRAIIKILNIVKVAM